jgi:hypothetical protein
VLQSDLFAVTALPPVPAMTGLLPLHVAPQKGEALASWIARFGCALRLSPLALGRMAFGIDAAAEPEWWRRPSTKRLGVIANKTGVDARELAAMTFAGWSSARDDEEPERSVAGAGLLRLRAIAGAVVGTYVWCAWLKTGAAICGFSG